MKVKACSLVLWLGFLTTTTSSFAQGSSMPPSSFGNDEVYDEFEDQDLVETEGEWRQHPSSELDTSQNERRADADYAVLLGLGEGSSWSTLALRGLAWFDERNAWSVYTGGGIFSSEELDSRYKFVTRSKSVGARWQWWPAKVFPIALSAEAGLHQWQVQAKCAPGVAESFCADGTLNAFGGSIAGGLLVSWLADQNIMVEWMVMGMKHSRFGGAKWSGSGEATVEADARKTIVGNHLVSFANFALGYRF